ncbi:hypothetical protein CORC01_12260 [Colletotrichum orchidophilum]|uniref:Rhodopsin domain-containing protein n=1 Tax=Colletotrichum orchidophilum TaxID=1209926 RepID=A0A1G4ATG7_9PEZI|nr:uncharacterized protein CORC01_12260 [Colletotrichum orchidophilum]OHE92469.1 hypothetical protein CORC01_12260 [Colletotrichum orchidophilum]
MSTSEPTDLAAQATAAAATESNQQFTIEVWTLYGIGVAVTVLRTYARAKAVGFRNFRADDYLVWGAILFYTVLSTLAYSIGNIANGLANNGMTDSERAALSTSDPEYQLRVTGSKIQIAGWTTYWVLIWQLKLAMLVFYLRLTEGLGRRYRMRILIGFGLVIGTFIASLGAVFLSCRPVSKYWQISPDPGNSCQAAVSLPIIWTSFATNALTDIYLILIPIPLLWGTTLRLVKKIASTIVLGAGIFVLVCATLKSIFVFVDPVNGAQLAGSWGTREIFVATVTTNLPMIFPLIRTHVKPLWPNFLRSTKNPKKVYRTTSGFRTIGVSHGDSIRRTGPPGANPVASIVTFTESKERIMSNVQMQNLEGFLTPTSGKLPNGIVVSNEVEVITEERTSQFGGQSHQRAYEAW